MITDEELLLDECHPNYRDVINEALMSLAPHEYEILPPIGTVKHGTQEENAERIRRMVELHPAFGPKKAMVECSQEFQLTLKTAEVYLRWARNEMLETLQPTQKEYILRTFEELQDIMNNEGVRTTDKLRALKLRMQHLGIAAPKVMQAQIVPQLQFNLYANSDY